eukprot:TRINITY_DN9605_c0_g1_i18.p1 TRINITY_DN9605_c0_g1~~TRINITY_DN9605_c0_g1_i18.p1  ORF type:complete len:152 (+),score=2.37 TRINITY_DN9605_c0_g1_i18:971-1426(+)
MKDLPEVPSGEVHLCHIHGEFCGHPTIVHDNHIDFVCDGELHFVSRSGAVYPHKLAVTDTNPAHCKFLDFSLDDEPRGEGKIGYLPWEKKAEMEIWHRHSVSCGHPRVIHGDHIDYLVNGRLEYPHEDHIDDHGPLVIFKGIVFIIWIELM